MKKHLFLISIVFFYICSDSKACQDPKPAPKSLIQVNMLGRLIQPRTRTQMQNVLVFQNCKSLHVNFINTLGVVDVEVLSKDNSSDSSVYKKRIIAAGGSEVAIEIGAWKKGKYIISVCDLDKNCANGEFEIK